MLARGGCNVSSIGGACDSQAFSAFRLSISEVSLVVCIQFELFRQLLLRQVESLVVHAPVVGS